MGAKSNGKPGKTVLPLSSYCSKNGPSKSKDGNTKPREHIEPARNLASRKSVRLGMMVWAKLDGWPWWPGIVISYSDCGLPPPKKPTNYWVYWFGGHHTVSELPVEKLSGFLDDRFMKLINLSWNTLYDKGVIEALRALTHFKDFPKLSSGPADKLKQWVLRNWQPLKTSNNRDVVLEQFPNWLEKSIIKIRDTNTKLKKISKEKKESKVSLFQDNKEQKVKKPVKDEEVTYGARDCDIAVVDRIKAGTLDIEYFCLGCHVEVMGSCLEHPLFMGGICYRECKNELLATTYGIGEDDIHVSCAICGSTGECLVCEKGSCSRVYCAYCVELLVGEGSRENIMKKTPWFCFLCAPFTPETHGLLQPRPDWVQRLRAFLHPHVERDLGQFIATKGRPVLRVVVLHDNLGAVNHAIHSSRLKLDKYFGSGRWDELNELNARDFVELKNANEMTDDDWADICPIHLLISCLPMRTVAVNQHNPTGREVGRRLFVHGDAGEAFFDFFRIKSCIERNNGGIPLMWAIENVESYHITISRFLQMEPISFDIKDGCGALKNRLIWTNIPEQNFNPQLDELTSYTSIAGHPSSREPFFVKYPWILEDIVAMNQPLPSKWQEKHDRLLFQRETRSKTTKLCKTPAYLEHYSIVRLAQSKKKKNGSSSVWKERHSGLSSDDEDNESRTQLAYVANLTDNATYAKSLGFSEPFPEFVSHLDECDVQERLNRSLPVSLWAHLFQPILKVAQTVDD